jgi:hypothetical protein
MFLAAAAAQTALAALPAVSYLQPDRYTVPLGEAAALRLYAVDGQGAKATAWPADQMKWFFIRGGLNQENRDSVAAAKPGGDFTNVEVKHSGVTMVGIDLQPRVREIAPADWQALLQARVAAQTEGRSTTGDKLKVRFVESTKTLLRASLATGEAHGSRIATSKTGLAAEILPLMDPTVTVGSDVAVRVFTDGTARDGVLVRATHVATQQAVTFTTDKVGSGHFRVFAPGVWRMEFHHVTRGTEGADWNLYSGTLTFETLGISAAPAEGAGQ